MNFTFNKKYFSDNEIIEYVNSPKMHVTILSFTDDYGYILTCPVWCIFYRDKFYFSTDDNSKKYKAITRKNSKISLSIIERDSFPNGRPGVIPYFSVSGTAKIRRKEEFDDYRLVLDRMYKKFDGGFANEDQKQDWIDQVLNKMKTRVLVELTPEKTTVYQKIEEYVKKLKAEK